MSIDITMAGAVATITLNRPEKLNALSPDMRHELIEAAHQVRFDDAVRAVVITGAGRAFCAGADVTKMGGRDLLAARHHLQAHAHPIITSIFEIEKPVIASVRGHAVGIGWSIALACDTIVASRTAKFSQIYRKLGLAPDGGAAWFLMTRLGMGRAKELVFSGRSVEAEEAAALGLVETLVEDENLAMETARIAADYASGPTFAFGMAKKMFNQGAHLDLRSFLEMESLMQPQLNQTADHKAGIAAFRDKTSAEFQGR